MEVLWIRVSYGRGVTVKTTEACCQTLLQPSVRGSKAAFPQSAVGTDVNGQGGNQTPSKYRLCGTPQKNSQKEIETT